MWVAGFGSDEGAVLPAFIGPQHRHQRQAHAGDGQGRGGSRRQRCCRRALAEDKQTGTHQQDGAYLDSRRYAERAGAFTRAKYSQPHQAEDERDGDDLSHEWGDGPELLQVIGCGYGQRGDGARADDEEQGPAVKKSGEGAEAITDVRVQAAGALLHGAEFAIRQRAHQRQQAAHQPHRRRNGHRATALRQHGAGDQEDARADDAADHQNGQIPRAQGPLQFMAHRFPLARCRQSRIPLWRRSGRRRTTASRRWVPECGAGCSPRPSPSGR